MVTKLKVDVEKSLGYQANGRVKAEKIEKANIAMKDFWCNECQKSFKLISTEFGAKVVCPECGNKLFQMVSHE